MLVSEVFKNKAKITIKITTKKKILQTTNIPDLLGNKDLLLKMDYVLNFFHAFASLENLCSECFVTISAFDYRLHHHLIYFSLMGNIFLSLSNILKLGNLTCFSLRKVTFIR